MKRISGYLALSMVLVCLAMAVEEPKVQPKPDSTQKSIKDTIMKDTTVAKPAVETPWTTNKSGLKWRDMVVGKGAAAAMNMKVDCHYTVWLTDQDGKKGKFVQSSKGGSPFQCQIGHQLIAGWSEGMVGMKEGGSRELRVTPALGWGDRAMGDMIPPNSFVYFEIEFLNEVKK